MSKAVEDQNEKVGRPATAAEIYAASIGQMVNAFLQWPLPETVIPDEIAMKPGAAGRTGTCLLTANEARQMLEYVTVGQFPPARRMPSASDFPSFALRQRMERARAQSYSTLVTVDRELSDAELELSASYIELYSFVMKAFGLVPPPGYELGAAGPPSPYSITGRAQAKGL